MQARVSAVLGRDDAAYAATATPNGYRAENPVNHLTAAFDASGVRVKDAGNDWGLSLQGYGYGDAPRAVAAAEPRAQANRVEYARGDMTEWYENGPLGLEQGFTLTSPPTGEGHTLTLALALGGNLQARVNASGDSFSRERTHEIATSTFIGNELSAGILWLVGSGIEAQFGRSSSGRDPLSSV